MNFTRRLNKEYRFEKSKFNIADHLNGIYSLFQEEMVVLIELIWFLYLELMSNNSNIEKKDTWGVPTAECNVLSRKFQVHINKSGLVPLQPSFIRTCQNMKDNKIRSFLT